MELPNGLDWADGLDGRLGTQTPAGAVRIASGAGEGTANVPIEEEVDSPEIERAEQATITHRFTMSYDEAITRLASHGRGKILTDSIGNMTKLLSARVQRRKGNLASFTIVAEGVSFDSPPDQFQIVPVELGINILKHPRYFYAFLGDGQGSATELKNQMVVRMLQNYFENPTAAFRDAISDLLLRSISFVDGTGPQPPDYKGRFDPADPENTGYQSPDTETIYKVSGTDMAKRAALEIVQKYWRGEETPYVVGWQITWSSFFFRPPRINPGGYVEDPIYEAVPQLPEYFFSTEYPPDPAYTIFDMIAAHNPQCYSDDGTATGEVNISWLRKADQLFYERTWFRLERTWIGSPVGFWDTELYSRTARPATADDYLETWVPTV